MFFAHKTPMLLNDNNTQICLSIFEQECACLESCLPSCHLCKRNNCVQQKQHGRYLKTRPWCSHGISVRDFQGWKHESSQSLGVRYCAAKSKHFNQGIMMSLSRRMIDLVIPTTFPSSSSSWSSSSFLENLPKNGKKQLKLNSEVFKVGVFKDFSCGGLPGKVHLREIWQEVGIWFFFPFEKLTWNLQTDGYFRGA